MVGMTLVLTAALVGGVQAQQQHEQHHPGSAQTAQPQPAETDTGVPAQPQQIQGMMENMQGMMQHMQGMMARMQGMMGQRGMGTMAQEDEDEDASPQRGLMGRRGMMGRHMERLAQQLELTDAQQAQVRALLRNHAKEAMRLRTDIGVLAVDVQQLLETDPVDLPKAKQLFQSIGAKEADLRLAHVTLMQEVDKLLTPEQHKKFRTMRERMMGMDGMMSMGGMMGRGRRER
jgi:Spy/CpxP family protein refolding chaperone